MSVTIIERKQFELRTHPDFIEKSECSNPFLSYFGAIGLALLETIVRGKACKKFLCGLPAALAEKIVSARNLANQRDFQAEMDVYQRLFELINSEEYSRQQLMGWIIQYMEGNMDNATNSMIIATKLIICAILENKEFLHNEIFSDVPLTDEKYTTISQNICMSLPIHLKIIYYDGTEKLFERPRGSESPLIVIHQNSYDMFYLLYHRKVIEFDQNDVSDFNLVCPPFVHDSSKSNKYQLNTKASNMKPVLPVMDHGKQILNKLPQPPMPIPNQINKPTEIRQENLSGPVNVSTPIDPLNEKSKNSEIAFNMPQSSLPFANQIIKPNEIIQDPKSNSIKMPSPSPVLPVYIPISEANKNLSNQKLKPNYDPVKASNVLLKEKNHLVGTSEKPLVENSNPPVSNPAESNALSQNNFKPSFSVIRKASGDQSNIKLQDSKILTSGTNQVISPPNGDIPKPSLPTLEFPKPNLPIPEVSSIIITSQEMPKSIISIPKPNLPMPGVSPLAVSPQEMSKSSIPMPKPPQQLLLNKNIPFSEAEMLKNQIPTAGKLNPNPLISSTPIANPPNQGMPYPEKLKQSIPFPSSDKNKIPAVVPIVNIPIPSAPIGNLSSLASPNQSMSNQKISLLPIPTPEIIKPSTPFPSFPVVKHNQEIPKPEIPIPGQNLKMALPGTVIPQSNEEVNKPKIPDSGALKAFPTPDLSKVSTPIPILPNQSSNKVDPAAKIPLPVVNQSLQGIPNQGLLKPSSNFSFQSEIPNQAVPGVLNQGVIEPSSEIPLPSGISPQGVSNAEPLRSTIPSPNPPIFQPPIFQPPIFQPPIPTTEKSNLGIINPSKLPSHNPLQPAVEKPNPGFPLLLPAKPIQNYGLTIVENPGSSNSQMKKDNYIYKPIPPPNVMKPQSIINPGQLSNNSISNNAPNIPIPNSIKSSSSGQNESNNIEKQDNTKNINPIPMPIAPPQNKVKDSPVINAQSPNLPANFSGNRPPAFLQSINANIVNKPANLLENNPIKDIPKPDNNLINSGIKMPIPFPQTDLHKNSGPSGIKGDSAKGFPLPSFPNITPSNISANNSVSKESAVKADSAKGFPGPSVSNFIPVPNMQVSSNLNKESAAKGDSAKGLPLPGVQNSDGIQKTVNMQGKSINKESIIKGDSSKAPFPAASNIENIPKPINPIVFNNNTESQGIPIKKVPSIPKVPYSSAFSTGPKSPPMPTIEKNPYIIEKNPPSVPKVNQSNYDQNLVDIINAFSDAFIGAKMQSTSVILAIEKAIGNDMNIINVPGLQNVLKTREIQKSVILSKIRCAICFIEKDNDDFTSISCGEIGCNICSKCRVASAKKGCQECGRTYSDYESSLLEVLGISLFN